MDHLEEHDNMQNLLLLNNLKVIKVFLEWTVNPQAPCV